MKTRLFIFHFSLLLVLLVSSCTKNNPVAPGTTQTSIVRGFVVRSDDQSRVPNVIVNDVKGTAPADTTDSNGAFALSYQLDKEYSGILFARLTGFTNDSISFTLLPGAIDTLPRSLVLKADSTSPKTASASGQVASIVLVAGGDVQSLAIRGTGFPESTPLTFQARDSVGVPVFGNHKVTIYFSLLGGPGGGEYVFPASAVTDLSGSAVTRVASGTRPGVLQVYAYARPDTTKPNYLVTSAPVRLTISGGLPDAAHFSMNVEKNNIAGISQDNLRDGISVIVGDRFGNPVQLGTAVYFSTSAGIIQPSARTDANGAASVLLITANPRPSSSGQVFITARTIGDSGAVVVHTDTILFTGPPTIIGPPSNFQIVDSGSYSFLYRVSDVNGNPLSSGTTITVSKDGPGAGDLLLTGDVSKTMIDTKDSTQTVFRVQVQDGSRGGASGIVKFTILVTGENGTASYSWTGEQLAEGVSPIGASTGIAASIQLTGTSATTISVRGTGASETAVLSFQVKDSLGNPITAPNSVPLTFSIQNGPGGGEFLFPATAITDPRGRASTTISSGTKSGVVQIIASTTLSNGTQVKSSPVPMTIASGLADPAHATMWSTLNVSNYPLLVNPGTTFGGVIRVQLGDRYGNPAQPSAVYFTTNTGLITASAMTDNQGQASASLISSDRPLPAGGIDTITSITQGENGQNITQRIIVTASGRPVVAAPGLPGGTISPLSAGGVQVVALDVKDINGNPLSAGNIIAVNLIGDPTVTGQISLSLNNSGASITTTDTRDTSSVRYTLKLTANAGGIALGGSYILNVSSTGPNGSASMQLAGTLLPKGVTIPPSPTAKLPAQIIPSAPSSTDLSVVGVGGVESSQLSFQVLDSTRAPLDKNNRVYAAFSVDFFPNTIVSGGTAPHLLPVADSTDDNGVVRMSIVSGSEAGVAQIVARIQLTPTVTIVSQPVRIVIHSGFADRAHFTLMQDHYVVASGATPTFTVAIGDTFGNPVASGTAVYFYSQAGIMNPGSGFTNASGFASNSLGTGINPTPDAAGTTLAGRPTYDATYGPGYHWVYGQTKGNGGTSIIDSALIEVAVGPITITGLPVTLPILSGGSSGPVNCVITDGNNHPLPDGTTISITFTYVNSTNFSFAYSANGDLSSSLTFTMPNNASSQFAGPGVTSFTFKVTDVSAPPTPAGRSIGINIIVNAPGLGILSKSFPGVF